MTVAEGFSREAYEGSWRFFVSLWINKFDSEGILGIWSIFAKKMVLVLLMLRDGISVKLADLRSAYK